MERSSKIKSAAFILFFYLPVIVLYLHFDFHESFPTISWKSVLYSISHSLLIGFFIILVSFIAALGLNSFRDQLSYQIFKVIENFLIAPLFLPAIFTLMICLSVFQPFPFGFFGVTFVFLMSYLGLFSLQFVQSFNDQQSIESSYLVLSENKLTYLIRIYLPLHLKEFVGWWLFASSLVLTSLSVPMIAGGDSFYSLELLLVDRMRRGPDWNGALFYSSIEIGLLIGLYLLAPKFRLIQKNASENEIAASALMHSRWGLIPVGAWVIAVLWGLASVMRALPWGIAVPFSVLEPLILGSFLQGILATLIFIIIFILIIYAGIKMRSYSWLHYLALPSVAILGASFMIGFSSSILVVLLKISFVLTYISLPGLLRLGLLADLESLQNYIQMAQQMGASNLQILFKVVLPMIKKRFALASGLLAAWGAGDFVISSLFTGSTINLGLAIQNSLDRYETSEAAFLSVILVVISLLLFQFFRVTLDQMLKLRS